MVLLLTKNSRAALSNVTSCAKCSSMKRFRRSNRSGTSAGGVGRSTSSSARAMFTSNSSVVAHTTACQPGAPRAASPQPASNSFAIPSQRVLAVRSTPNRWFFSSSGHIGRTLSTYSWLNHTTQRLYGSAIFSASKGRWLTPGGMSTMSPWRRRYRCVPSRYCVLPPVQYIIS